MDDELKYRKRVEQVLAELRQVGDAPPVELPTIEVLREVVAVISDRTSTLLELTAVTGRKAPATVELIGDLGEFAATQVRDITPDDNLPGGLAEAAPRRRMGRQVAALRSPDLDDALLTRWLMRRSTQMRFPLGGETVAMVHRVAQIERLDELDQLVFPDRGSPVQETNHDLAVLGRDVGDSW